MRTVEEIIYSVASEWRSSGNSEPILRGAKELIEEERFDELDEFLLYVKKTFFLPATAISYIKSKIAPIIFNSHLYKCDEISHRVLELHWSDEDMAKEVSGAAFKPGALPKVVARIKCKLIELSINI